MIFNCLQNVQNFALNYTVILILQSMKLLSGSSCQFFGKVINLGLPKSGTTSLSHVLRNFGYKANHGTNAVHKAKIWLAGDTDQVYLRHLYHLLHTLFFVYGERKNNDCTGNCSDINRFYRLDYLNRVEYVSHRSFNFGDTPKPYFYPLYTTWYPKQFKKVKYILTIRQDTNSIVNSRLRYDLQLLDPKTGYYVQQDTYHSTSIGYVFKQFVQMVQNWNWLPKKYEKERYKSTQYDKELIQFKQFLVSNLSLLRISELNMVVDRIESLDQRKRHIKRKRKSKKHRRTDFIIAHDYDGNIGTWIYFIENYYLSDWDIVNQAVPCKPCNKENNVKIQDFAHFLAMRYELHKKGVIDWFDNLQYKFGSDINDDILILRLKDDDSYQQLSSFLGCKIKDDQTMEQRNAATHIRYRVIPKHDILDWRSYFNGFIPILTVDKKNSRAKFEMIDDGPSGYDHLW